MLVLACFRTVCVMIALSVAPFVVAAEQRLSIYIDADYSVSPAAAEAIEVGLRTAFAGTWAEDTLRIIPRDHRRNARRSFDTIREAWQDDSAIAIIGGKQSPPYFLHGAEINAGRMPMLLPWSAGDALTRLSHGDGNWIFRLSVDDRKAHSKLVQAAIAEACRDLTVVVVDNPWGRSSAAGIASDLARRSLPAPRIVTLPRDAGEVTIQDSFHDAAFTEEDCVILVSGKRLGSGVLNELAQRDSVPRVISHWGILGSGFSDLVRFSDLERLRLRVLGTCGLQRAWENPELHAEIITRAAAFGPPGFDPTDHPTPHGFYHAYDLGRLVLSALEAARRDPQWDASPELRRAAFRDALYTLDAPIFGLLKRYTRPFRPVSAIHPDGHEALDSRDLCFTRFDPAGHVIALSPEPEP